MFDKKPGSPVKIQGKVVRVKYTSPNSQWAILEFRTRLKNDVVLVGSLAEFQEGDELKVEGVWAESKYGIQIRVEHCQVLLPNSEEGIQKYLASQITGIGAKMAKRITDVLGEDTLDILDNDPEKLLTVPGISRKKYDSIISEWKEKHASRQIYVFLQGLGLTFNMAAKLHGIYGDSVIPRVQHQPYSLAKDVDGIGFMRADEIARKVGFAEDSPQRIEAGVDYTLYQAEQNEGHCFLPFSYLVQKAANLLSVPQEAIHKVIRSMVERHAVHSELNELGEMIIYRSYMWNVENAVSKHVLRLIRHHAPEEKKEGNDENLEKCEENGFNDEEFEQKRLEKRLKLIRLVESSLGITLAESQREAVRLGLSERLLVITGGPGTGKTTLVKVFVEAAEKENTEVYLAAPTGRAAKRLSETTQRDAKTIHRLLEFSYQESPKGSFLRNRDNPLDPATYIIDEASMVDIQLMFSLMEAMPDEAHLIFVGDVDQLPSVGPGTVLKDLIRSKRVPVVRLTEVYRQAEQSLIVKNAHLINTGQFPVLPEPNKDVLSEFYLINSSNPEHAERMISQMVCERLPLRFNLDPKNDIQILCPMRKNPGGVDHINQLLQARLNPDGQPIPHPYLELRIGDRVMQLKNDYERDIYNGDIGHIINYSTAQKAVTVDFDGKIIDISQNDMENLSLSYACTVHKSQGSEYPAVICVFLGQQSFMLQRNLIYTALTRAKRVAIFITDRSTLYRAIQNNQPATRYTKLAERIFNDGYV